ncbi:hypothetical protein GGR53DRAFT_461824 [Hypoxylon sp. FL1150]|nr:hypothetical protein GGR53DRAFT_461824 [Hypoxylon sp. FL1150]
MASVYECSGVLSGDALPFLINSHSVLEHLQALQNHADQGNGSRMAGSHGHNLTIEYIRTHLRSAGYYVEVQPFRGLMQVQSEAQLTIGYENIRIDPIAWSPQINVTNLPIIPVNTQGCRPVDYPGEIYGGIVLVGSGGCSISTKSRAAHDAGAAALLLRDSTELEPSLGGLNAKHIPSARIRERDAQTIDKLPDPLWARGLEIRARYEYECGDDENMLMVGTHTDSANSSAGINDNGSGIAALLEVATQLAKFRTNSFVKFAFWTASEPCLLGSRRWFDVSHPEELNKIRLYLDVNMIGSPNGALKVYDGDGTYFHVSGPYGSGIAEQALRDGFSNQGVLQINGAEMSNRSDYAPFFERGIPFAGLFSGADGFKTEDEFSKFGGELDRPYDSNYQQVGDDVRNINATVLLVNTKALAHAVGIYGRGFDDSFPNRVADTGSSAGYEKYSGVVGLA